MTDPLSRYIEIQHRVQTGDVIEFRSNSVIGWAIRKVTGLDRNHSALVIRMPFADCAERRFVIEAVATGLELHLLSSVLRRLDGAAWWSPLQATDHQREDLAAWATVALAEQRGYDYGSLFRQLASRVSLDGKRYFCSEFVQAAIVMSGVAPPPGDGSALRPGEFSKLGCFGDPVKICG